MGTFVVLKFFGHIWGNARKLFFTLAEKLPAPTPMLKFFAYLFS